MAADDKSRFVTLHDLTFRAKGNKGAPLKLIREVGESYDIKQVLEQSYASKTAELKIKDDDTIDLARLSFRKDQGIAVLLLHRGDPKGVTPMFKDKKTKKIKGSGRTENDLIAYSCHVIIKLDPENINPPTHRVVIEETVGISPTYVSSFFRHVLGTATYSSNDKRGKEIEAVCTSDLKGYPSESVEDALHDGIIRQVHLVKPGELHEYDGEHIVPGNVVQTLKIKGRGRAVMNAIRNVWNANQDEWEQMRVTVVSQEKKAAL